jgi:cell division protein FtsB
MKWLTLALSALLVLVQGELWLGESGVRNRMKLQGEVDVQLAKNEELRQRNTRMQAEISDLKEGLEMVEEKARAELGMIKPDEMLVQVQKRR